MEIDFMELGVVVVVIEVVVNGMDRGIKILTLKTICNKIIVLSEEVVENQNAKIDYLTGLLETLVNKPKSKKFLNVKEAAELTGFAVQTIYTKVCRNEIPFKKIGGKLLFDENELIEFISGNS